MVAGGKFAFAVIGELCGGLQDFFRPCKQVFLAYREGADVLTPWLEDRHLYGFDVIDPVVGVQGSEGVTHHLRIVLSFHQDSKTIFEIYDLKDFVRYDETVAGSETVRYPLGEVQPLLYQNLRILA